MVLSYLYGFICGQPRCPDAISVKELDALRHDLGATLPVLSPPEHFALPRPEMLPSHIRDFQAAVPLHRIAGRCDAVIVEGVLLAAAKTKNRARI